MLFEDATVLLKVSHSVLMAPQMIGFLAFRYPDHEMSNAAEPAFRFKFKKEYQINSKIRAICFIPKDLRCWNYWRHKKYENNNIQERNQI